MKTIELLAALAMATAAPAMGRAMTGASTAPEQCVRRVDARGNISVICPNVREARAAWGARRPSYRGNYVVYYHDGRSMRMWKSWTRPMRRR